MAEDDTPHVGQPRYDPLREDSDEARPFSNIEYQGDLGPTDQAQQLPTRSGFDPAKRDDVLHGVAKESADLLGRDIGEQVHQYKIEQDRTWPFTRDELSRMEPGEADAILRARQVRAAEAALQQGAQDFGHLGESDDDISLVGSADEALRPSQVIEDSSPDATIRMPQSDIGASTSGETVQTIFDTGSEPTPPQTITPPQESGPHLDPYAGDEAPFTTPTARTRNDWMSPEDRANIRFEEMSETGDGASQERLGEIARRRPVQTPLPQVGFETEVALERLSAHVGDHESDDALNTFESPEGQETTLLERIIAIGRQGDVGMDEFASETFLPDDNYRDLVEGVQLPQFYAVAYQKSEDGANYEPVAYSGTDATTDNQFDHADQRILNKTITRAHRLEQDGAKINAEKDTALQLTEVPEEALTIFDIQFLDPEKMLNYENPDVDKGLMLFFQNNGFETDTALKHFKGAYEMYAADLGSRFADELFPVWNSQWFDGWYGDEDLEVSKEATSAYVSFSETRAIIDLESDEELLGFLEAKDTPSDPMPSVRGQIIDLGAYVNAIDLSKQREVLVDDDNFATIVVDRQTNTTNYFFKVNQESVGFVYRIDNQDKEASLILSYIENAEDKFSNLLSKLASNHPERAFTILSSVNEEDLPEYARKVLDKIPAGNRVNLHGEFSSNDFSEALETGEKSGDLTSSGPHLDLSDTPQLYQFSLDNVVLPNEPPKASMMNVTGNAFYILRDSLGETAGYGSLNETGNQAPSEDFTNTAVGEQARNIAEIGVMGLGGTQYAPQPALVGPEGTQIVDMQKELEYAIDELIKKKEQNKDLIKNGPLDEYDKGVLKQLEDDRSQNDKRKRELNDKLNDLLGNITQHEGPVCISLADEDLSNDQLKQEMYAFRETNQPYALQGKSLYFENGQHLGQFLQSPSGRKVLASFGFDENQLELENQNLRAKLALAARTIYMNEARFEKLEEQLARNDGSVSSEEFSLGESYGQGDADEFTFSHPDDDFDDYNEGQTMTTQTRTRSRRSNRDSGQESWKSLFFAAGLGILAVAANQWYQRSNVDVQPNATPQVAQTAPVDSSRRVVPGQVESDNYATLPAFARQRIENLESQVADVTSKSNHYQGQVGELTTQRDEYQERLTEVSAERNSLRRLALKQQIQLRRRRARDTGVPSYVSITDQKIRILDRENNQRYEFAFDGTPEERRSMKALSERLVGLRTSVANLEDLRVEGTQPYNTPAQNVQIIKTLFDRISGDDDTITMSELNRGAYLFDRTGQMGVNEE